LRAIVFARHSNGPESNVGVMFVGFVYQPLQIGLRILEAKERRLIIQQVSQIPFAPFPYNYIKLATVVDHLLVVRHDHIARAVENGVWFLRGNNFHPGTDEGSAYPGAGYSHSYLLDPNADVVVRAGLRREALISATITPKPISMAAFIASAVSSRGVNWERC
jgi:hypothetical protein